MNDRILRYFNENKKEIFTTFNDREVEKMEFTKIISIVVKQYELEFLYYNKERGTIEFYDNCGVITEVNGKRQIYGDIESKMDKINEDIDKLTRGERMKIKKN